MGVQRGSKRREPVTQAGMELCPGPPSPCRNANTCPGTHAWPARVGVHRAAATGKCLTGGAVAYSHFPLPCVTRL